MRPLDPDPLTALAKRAAAAGIAVTIVAASSGIAHADPQASVGLTVGPALTDLRTNPGLELHLGARGDMLFLRHRDSDMAVGPYVDVATAAFDSLELGSGIEWLVPITEQAPIVLSAGGLARHTGPFGWEPGVASTLFFGSRSYNFDSWYSLGAGIFTQVRYGLGDGKQLDAILGLQIDTELLAMPFIGLIALLRR